MGAGKITTVQVRSPGSSRVGFRAWTEQAARARPQAGCATAATAPVEAIISGPDDKVTDLLAYLWQGPTACRVDKVDAVPRPADATGFRTLPTA